MSYDQRLEKDLLLSKPVLMTSSPFIYKMFPWLLYKTYVDCFTQGLNVQEIRRDSSAWKSSLVTSALYNELIMILDTVFISLDIYSFSKIEYCACNYARMVNSKSIVGFTFVSTSPQSFDVFNEA